jgi:putative phage-type endonuclease
VITETQKAARERGIGSSDVPAILGISPWVTPMDLWLVRTGRAEPQAENAAMAMGSALEPVILKLASDRLEARVVSPSSTFVGAKPHHRANIDGMVGQAKRGAPIVEAKTSGRADDWGDDGTDEVPEHVRAQVLYQMACSSSDRAWVAVLLGDRGLRFQLHRVEWDADYAAHIIDRVDAFWGRVMTDTPPDAVASIEVAKRLRKDDSPTVDIDPGLFVADESARKALAAAQEVADAARSRLMVALGSSLRGAGGGYTATVSEVTTERFDAKQFRADHPDLAEPYMRPSSHQRLTIRTKKGGAA